MILGTALIVLCWTLLISLIPLWACIVLTVVGGIIIFFGLLFFVYLFNIDMKALSALQPLFAKIYDKRKREKRI